MRLRKYIKNKRKTTAFCPKCIKHICTPKCDAFGLNFFPLLSIMECYKPSR